MKSKTSFFNKGIIYDDVRRFGWIGIVYTLALFFIVPLQILMKYSSEELYNHEVLRNIFDLSNAEIQSIMMMAVPVLIGLFLFRYMQVKESSDMIHSLPVLRKVLYFSHILVGLLLMIIPVLLIGTICMLLNGALALETYYNIPDVLRWAGITLLMDMVFFFASVFVGMAVGSSIVQGVLTYILLVLPVGLMLLLTYNLNVFIYGFMYNVENGAEKLSPITRIITGFDKYHRLSITEIIVYLGLCILLCIIALFVYERRKLEAASQNIAFRSLQIVFKYGAAFCTMLLGGMYFQGTQHDMRWILFGFVIGSFAGYFIAEMVVRKSIWIFRNGKGYAVYIGIMLVLFLGISFDITGYESKQPTLDKVSSIYFSEGFYNLNLSKYNMDVYKDPNNIERISDLHKQLIEGKGRNKYNTEKQQRTIVFIYHMKDGSKLQRGYNISFEDYSKYLKPIYECEEYKKMHVELLNVDPSDIEKISINVSNKSDKMAVVLSPKEIQEAVEVLKQDIYNETYEQMSSQKAHWAEMSFMIESNKLKKYPKLNDPKVYGGDRQVHLTWKKSYVLFERWLTEKGYIDKARILPSDIGYVVVEQIKDPKTWDERSRTGKYIDENDASRLEIRDKDQIERCLRNYDYPYSNDSRRYVIGFYGTDNNLIEFGSFNEKDAPDFIVKHFHK